jgi:flavin-dependent dehydrogenase
LPNSSEPVESSAKRQPRDVTIVGASAAGLFAAERLAEQGVRVQVLERAERLAPASRTLIATNRLRELLGPRASGSVVNEIRGFDLFANGRVASVELDAPDLIVERSTLIRNLAECARLAGADIRTGQRFVGVEANGTAMNVVTARGESEEATSCGRLVGADGAFSRVARAAGWPEQTTVPLVQARVRCPDGLPQDTVRVWFRPKDTPYFYWLIPEGDGKGVLGLIGYSRREVRSHLDGFLAEKKLVPIAYQAARIPLYTRWRPVHRRVRHGAVYLVGDAAGHVKSTTVGGLVTGFRGAEAVVDAILGRRSGAIRALRRELDRHLLVRRALHRFGEHEYTRLLDLLGSPEHRLLAAYTRDDTYRLLWRLCVREPRIVGLAAARILAGRSAGWSADEPI